MPHRYWSVLCAGLFVLRAQALPPDCARTANGVVRGVEEAGIRSFKGIPFAAPPVGVWRWREPQPAQNWDGVRPADKFGPRAMQRPIFSDMQFRSDGVSEDCLYLNVWTPAKSDRERLPVLVYFYGGGLMAGDGSESRYDGASMAKMGIVSLTVNYRLGPFGFLALPELTQESPHHASGNYGLLDQYAALQWVRQNIAAFGGDPRRVTIAGESAGSFSVSAQMASPLSEHLFAGAIGESGALLGMTPLTTLAQAEVSGLKLATNLGAMSLADLRALPAATVLEATAKKGAPRLEPDVDGWFLPSDPTTIFAAGKQAHVPLLVGWNSAEGNHWAILGQNEPTRENLEKAIRKLYGANADAVLKVYGGDTPDDVTQAATDLAGDRFIAFGTWKWFDLQRKTGGKPVYRYYYAHPRPPQVGKPHGGPSEGAAHSAEIEYAMGNLPGNKVFAWTLDDYALSDTMQHYFANFIKTGNPNGPGLPYWPADTAHRPVEIMRIDVRCEAMPESHPDRYRALDGLSTAR
jgi:para-nitrobenzyl esterase